MIIFILKTVFYLVYDYFQYNNVVQEVDESSPTKAPLTKQLILERDDEGKEPILEVDKDLVVKLKPHQVEGEFVVCMDSRYSSCTVIPSPLSMQHQGVRVWLAGNQNNVSECSDVYLLTVVSVS